MTAKPVNPKMSISEMVVAGLAVALVMTEASPPSVGPKPARMSSDAPSRIAQLTGVEAPERN